MRCRRLLRLLQIGGVDEDHGTSAVYLVKEIEHFVGKLAVIGSGLNGVRRGSGAVGVKQKTCRRYLGVVDRAGRILLSITHERLPLFEPRHGYGVNHAWILLGLYTRMGGNGAFMALAVSGQNKPNKTARSKMIQMNRNPANICNESIDNH